MKRVQRWLVGAVAMGLLGCGGSGGGPITQPDVLIWGSSDAGLINGGPDVARFANPVNVCAAPDGVVYVCDFDNNVIRKIDPSGVVSTLTSQNNFQRPFGITLTKSGVLYVQTDQNDVFQRDATTGTIWRIDRTTGVPTVVARNLGRPRGIAALPDGRIACSDLGNSTVYILDPSTATKIPLAGAANTPGFADGNGTNAKFDRPYGLGVDTDGSLLVADQNNNRIRRVTLAGEVTTFAGAATPGNVNGAIGSARFNLPEDVEVDSDGRVYVADHDNFSVRRIYRGEVTLVAGNGVEGFAPGVGSAAQFHGLEGINISPDGKTLWIADGTNGDDVPFNRVRRQKVR